MRHFIENRIQQLHFRNLKVLCHIDRASHNVAQRTDMNVGNDNLAIHEFHINTIARAIFRLGIQQLFIEWNGGVCFCVNRL